MKAMRIVIGSDHAAYELKEAIKEKLTGEGHEVIDVGCDSTESVDYPKYGTISVDYRIKFDSFFSRRNVLEIEVMPS